MTYRRVIPRDLFNEGSLLKMLGHLWLKLEALPTGTHCADLDWARPIDEGLPFIIEQAPGDGLISVSSLRLLVGGLTYRLFRPLNSREPWPLYATDDDDEETPVFDTAGNLDHGFLALIGVKQP